MLLAQKKKNNKENQRFTTSSNKFVASVKAHNILRVYLTSTGQRYIFILYLLSYY